MEATKDVAMPPDSAEPRPTEIFKTTAFASFKKFIGELTATSAGIHVGLLLAVSSLEKVEAQDRWQFVGKQYGIKIDGLNSERVIDSSTRLAIVSLYSGFDLFVSDTRDQFHYILGKEWLQHEGDTPFDSLARSVGMKRADFDFRVGEDLVAVMNYFRLTRNAIAHPGDEVLKMAKDFYNDNENLLTKARSRYGMSTAPNAFDTLGFHDLKLLARVSLDLAERMDQTLDPGDDRLASLVPSEILTRPKSQERNHNAIRGWLATTFGICGPRSDDIIALVTHKLNG